MMTRRMATAPPPEPSVKFYKTIAVSFLVITLLLLGGVMVVTSKRATIVVVAKEDSKTLDLAIRAEGTPSSEGSLPATVSSSVFKWSKTYYPTGSKVLEGVSLGEVTIYNKTNSAQPLVKTTRLLTANGKLFHLDKTVTVPAAGQVVVSVYADKPGAEYDVVPGRFTIPGLNPQKQGVIYAESTKPFNGGARKVGVLSQEDLAAAQADYKDKVRQAYAESLVTTGTESDVGRAVVVVGSSAAANHKLGEEVDSFTLTGTSTVVVVKYVKNDLKDLVNKEIAKKFDTTAEKILSLNRVPEVSITSFDLHSGAAQFTTSQNLLVTIDANSEKLAPQKFLGKSKGDIERYILGIDHVSGVDVTFSPSWVLSAPSVPDRIKVVVKNIN